MTLFVSQSASGPQLSINGKRYACAIGRGGIGAKGGEGDGITPVGTFPIRQLFFRADRLAPPVTNIPVSEIDPNDGWCDAPGDPNYNRFVKHPYPASAEHLWREDHMYDLIVVLGYNDDPVVDGKGSAIFLHVAKPGYVPTEGCVALEVNDLLAVVAKLGPADRIMIFAQAE